MKRFAPFFMLFAASVAVAPVAGATGKPLSLNTVVVNHFTNANGMAQSQDFIKFFADYISEELVKDKVAAQVVDQGTTVPDAAAANSVVIEGKFLSHEDAGLIKPGKLIVEISIYRLNDHALVRTWTATTHFPLNGDRKDRPYAYYTGSAAGDTISDALESVSLSSIPPAGTGSGPTVRDTGQDTGQGSASGSATGSAPATATGTALAPSSDAAPATPDALASVQLSSNPAGAEIAVDGNYVGNTPSLIKLKPGTHSITMTMPGYAPWVRSIETAAGESRNFAATLEKTSQ